MQFEEEEFNAWGRHVAGYFLDVLNGSTSIEEARENLASFRNSELYTGTNPEFKKVINE